MVGSAVLVLIAVVGIHQVSIQKVLKQELETKSALIQRTLSVSLRHSFYGYDVASMQDAIQAEFFEPYVRAILIYEPDGSHLILGMKSENGNTFEIAQPPADPSLYATTFPINFKDVDGSQVVLGVVRAYFDGDYLRSRYNTDLWLRLGETISIIGLLIILLALISNRFIVAPLESIQSLIIQYRQSQLDDTPMPMPAKDFRLMRTVRAGFKDIQEIADSFIELTITIHERRRALKESEEKFRAIFNGVNDAVFIHHAETGEILDVNQRTLEMYGMAREEALAATIVDISEGVSPYGEEEARKYVFDAANDKNPVFEWHAKRKNGELFWVEVGLKRVEIGERVRVVGVIRDISERKRQEEEILREKRFSDAVIASLPGIFYVYNAQQELIRWNRNHEILSGFSADELRGKSILDWYTDYHRDVVARKLGTLYSKGSGSVEIPIKNRGGDLIWFHLSASTLDMPEGKYIIGIGIDISEEKRTEEMLRDIVDTSKDWIWAIDKNQVHTFSNPACRQILGFDPEEVVGKRMDRLHEDDKMMVEANWPKWVEEKKGWTGVQLRWKHKNGEIRYLESNATPILGVQNELLGFRGVDRDITERIQTEAALRERDLQIRALFNHSLTFFGLLDCDGKVLMANRPALDFGGYTEKEVYGTLFWETRYFKGLPEIQEQMKDVVQRASAGESIRLETVSVDTQGNILEFDFSMNPIVDDYGKVVYLFIEARDITNQKAAVRDMEESRNRFQTLFESASDAIFLMKDDLFIDCNKKTLEMFDCTREQIIGQPPYKFSPERQPDGSDSRTRALQKINAAFTGEVQRFEWVHVTYDGRAFDAEVSLTVLNIGEDHFLQAIVRDITEKKHYQSALEKSESKFRLIFDKAPMGIALVRENGSFVDINNRLMQWAGYNPEKKSELLENLSLFDIAPLDYLERYREIISKVIHGEIDEIREERTFHVPNGEMWLDAINTRFQDVETGEWLLLGTNVDITERKKVERALAESESKFRNIVESPLTGFAIVDKDWNFTFVNDYLIDLFKLDREEEMWPIFPMLPQHSRDKVMDYRSRRLAGEEAPSTYELDMDNKEGRHLVVQISVSIPHSSEANPDDYFQYVHVVDITDLKKLEADRLEAARMMEQSARLSSIGIIAGGVTHEINQPLNAIKLQAEPLQFLNDSRRLESTDLLRESLSEILLSTDQISSIIQHMRSFWIEPSRFAESEVVNVVQSVESALQFIHQRLVGHSISIKTKYPENQALILCIPIQLEQIVINLATNSINALDSVDQEEKRIEIQVDLDPHKVVLRVLDNGPGLPTEDPAQLFDPFFSTGKKTGGTGLGLAIVRQLVERHKGNVVIHNRPGGGAVVEAQFPVYHEE